MGVIKRGILGGFSGSVGNIVGSSWKGIATMKAKPLSVANPQTAGQTAQRTKFAGTVALASLFLVGLVKPFWDRFAQGESGYNAFVRTNLDTFVGTVFTNFADLKISIGKLLGEPISSVGASNSSSALTLFFGDSSGNGNALGTDEAVAIVYNATTNKWSSLSAPSQRNDTEIEVPFTTPLVTGNLLKCFLAFRRPDGTLVSNTSFFAKTVTA